MKKAIKKLVQVIGDDYGRWASRAFEANYSKINEFRDSIEVKEGSKYIKITTGNSVWGFVNKGNKDVDGQYQECLREAMNDGALP